MLAHHLGISYKLAAMRSGNAPDLCVNRSFDNLPSTVVIVEDGRKSWTPVRVLRLKFLCT
ncbi:unnamed protein product [Tenebrio molitor]|nr:unnamed protein product [Tenebrio molitor]